MKKGPEIHRGKGGKGVDAPDLNLVWDLHP